MTHMANTNELEAAASFGAINILYRAIQQDPCILEKLDSTPFVNTPLHIAAHAEIMRLKPSFGWKLNEQDSVPQNNVRRPVEINKDLVRVKGREGVTPLHFVCESGDNEENMTLLKDLLKACPESIKDVNVRNEIALHIALINRNLNELIGRLKSNVSKDAYSLERSILNVKDSYGNTLLHIAALTNNEQAVDLLMKTMVDINARNLENQMALDLAEAYPTIKSRLSNFTAEREDKPTCVILAASMFR